MFETVLQCEFVKIPNAANKNRYQVKFLCPKSTFQVCNWPLSNSTHQLKFDFTLEVEKRMDSRKILKWYGRHLVHFTPAHMRLTTILCVGIHASIKFNAADTKMYEIPFKQKLLLQTRSTEPPSLYPYSMAKSRL